MFMYTELVGVLRLFRFLPTTSVIVGVVRMGATVAMGANTENSFSGDFNGDPLAAAPLRFPFWGDMQFL